MQKYPIILRDTNDRLQRRCYDTGKSQIIQCRFFNIGVQVPHNDIDVEFDNTVTWESCISIELSCSQITLSVK